jgi:hypothetical protein
MNSVADLAPTVQIARATLFLEAAVREGDAKQIAKAQRALDRAKGAQDLEAEHTRRLEAATLKVATEKREADKVAKQAKADAIESLILQHSPYAEVHANGKVVKIDLGNPESRTFGVEALRRVAYQASHRFHEKIVGSRALGMVQPERDWLTPMLDDAYGLQLAIRYKLVSIDHESH